MVSLSLEGRTAVSAARLLEFRTVTTVTTLLSIPLDINLVVTLFVTLVITMVFTVADPTKNYFLPSIFTIRIQYILRYNYPWYIYHFLIIVNLSVGSYQ